MLINDIVSFAFFNSSVSIFTCPRKSSIIKFLGSSFLVGLFAIIAALEAYYRVETFSSKY